MERRLARPPSAYAVAFILALAAGAATEGVQLFLGRDASVTDFRNDAFGAAAGLLVYAAVAERQLPHAVRGAAGVGGMVLLLLPSMPLAVAMEAYSRRDAHYPRLMAFDTAADLYFITAQRARCRQTLIPARWAARTGERALLVELGGEQWPGIDLFEPAPDWRGYDALVVDLVNPADRPLNLVLRVHDVDHDSEFTDRFNKEIVVPPLTRTSFRTPLAEIEAAPEGRRMDLGRIADVMVFAVAQSAGQELYLAGVWLE
jgi:hypothetical protein